MNRRSFFARVAAAGVMAAMFPWVRMPLRRAAPTAAALATRLMLRHARPALVMGRFLADRRLPVGKATTITFRRPTEFRV